MTLPELLPWIAPPLVGALIGYVTNAVAIRMLFRPLRPWRIAGVRLPLTPGIIPARRQELARQIGRMVGDHLLTGADVARALDNPAFRRELQAAVAERLAPLLDRELGTVRALLPPELGPLLERSAEGLGGWAGRELAATLASPDVAVGLEQQLAAWLQHDLADLLGADASRLRTAVTGAIDRLLQRGELSAALASLAEQKLMALLASPRPLRELLPADLAAVLLQALEREVPALLQHLAQALNEPAFRQRLVGRIKDALEATLDRLEGMTAVMAALLDWDAVHARIPEFLDRAAEEFATWLQRQESRQKVAQLLRQRLDRWLDTPVQTLAAGLGSEREEALRIFVRTRMEETLRHPRTREQLQALVGRGVERLAAQPLTDLLQPLQATGTAPAAALAPGLLRVLKALLPPAQLESWGRQGGRLLLDRPLGRLTERLPADLRDRLQEQLCALLAELLQREVPPLVEALGVDRVVEEKVNRLDILQVEELLLAIMREQFTWINLFGALLGLLIGGVNVLLQMWR